MDDLIQKCLLDILESINGIDSYLGGKRDFLEYQKNRMLRKAVERELEIIGEAMTRILRSSPDIEITDKHKIIGMRNAVAHGYDKVEDEVVWGVISRHLPLLKDEIGNLLSYGS